MADIWDRRNSRQKVLPHKGKGKEVLVSAKLSAPTFQYQSSVTPSFTRYVSESYNPLFVVMKVLTPTTPLSYSEVIVIPYLSVLTVIGQTTLSQFVSKSTFADTSDREMELIYTVDKVLTVAEKEVLTQSEDKFLLLMWIEN
jgi:outer membrane lipopolysaccharide assembly protein LptE/RlpB